MTFVVPFDGSELSKTALVRAAQFDSALGESAEEIDEGVLAITIVPMNNAAYARERGWLGADEPFDLETIVSGLRESVTRLAPDARFDYQTVDRYAPGGTIGTRLRRMARAADASIVFVGSEDAGRIANRITVGKRLVADPSYDTMIISHPSPARVAELEDIGPSTDPIL